MLDGVDQGDDVLAVGPGPGRPGFEEADVDTNNYGVRFRARTRSR